MYKQYFGLIDAPFSIAPNPHYLYMSERHREALAHLLYGVTMDSGFILLTGEVGTGKTTVCRCLLEQIPDNADVAFILNPKMTSRELLATICDELKLDYPDDCSIKVLIDKLNERLLITNTQNRKTVLIIDEAQNLSIDVLEQLRLLTNLETNQRKLIQVILLGQPELLNLLERKELRQLSQRVTARFHLEALNKDEVTNYISHRLTVAGAKSSLFPAKVSKHIYKKSRGIPRLINLLCDRSLLGTYAQNRLIVDIKTVDQAAKEIFGATTTSSRVTTTVLLACLILVGSAALAWTLARMQKPVGLAPASVVELAAAEDSEIDSPPVTADPPVSTSDTPTVANTDTTVETLTPITTEAIPAQALIGELPPRAAEDQDQSTSLSEIFQTEEHADFNTAFKDLLALWSVDFQPDDLTLPCDFSQQYELKCVQRIGSLRDIKHIDRPVILNLMHNDGLQHYATLHSVDGDWVTLISEGQQYRVEVTDLNSHWTGEFTLLWKTPPGYRTAIVSGDSGADVNWLEEQLAMILHNDQRTADDLTYDAILQEQVKMFQISAGLIPDGIVGTNTWIQINSIVLENLPRILQATE